MSNKPDLISGTMIRDLRLCERKLALDMHGDPTRRDPVSGFTRMLWREGLAHEDRVLAGLGADAADLRGLERDERQRHTLDAIEAHTPVILGAVIEHDDLVGMPDLLCLTENGYVAEDVKSGSAMEGQRPDYRRDYLVQVAHYAYILSQLGLGRGDVAGIVDRTGTTVEYDLLAPVGRDGLTGTELHLTLLRQARQIRRDPTGTRGALSAACGMCEWKTHCRAEMTEADDLTRITGLGRAVRTSIETIAGSVGALAKLDPASIIALPGVGVERLRRFHDRARLLADPTAGPVVREPLHLPTVDHAIDFDVEADPLRGIVYLHGFWHCRADGEREFVHFFAETPDAAGEREAFALAIDHFRSHCDAHWFHYSQYERTAYRSLQARHPDVCSAAEIDAIFATERCTDVYNIVAGQTDWPLSSNGIKAIAVACGFNWEDQDPGGANSVEWYDRYVRGGDVGLRERIVAYNRDDVRASEVVRDALRELETAGRIARFQRK